MSTDDLRSDPAFVNRVQLSHAATRSTIRLTLVFIVAAAISVVVGPSPWMPLHLFLAGGAALAISGVSQMLTVTWAAAPAPGRTAVIAQRTAIAVGAAGVVVTREVDSLPDWSPGVPGALYVLGLVILVGILISTARRGVERRFDVAVAFYVLAALSALAAVGVGIHMASSGISLELRGVHVVLNLLGFVGLTMAGSLPFFAATVGRSRMAPAATPFRLSVLLAAMVVSLGTIVAGLVLESSGVAFIGFSGYIYGLIAVYCFVPRPTRRQFDWSGPRVVALWCGGLWWIGALGITAFELVADHRPPFLDRWTHVLVVGAYAQIFWGSLAYLIPMLRGGGHAKLSEGFARTRSWVGFGAINASAGAIAFGYPEAGVVCLAVTVVDGIWRTLQVGVGQAPRPEPV